MTLTLAWLLTDALIYTGAYSLAYFIKVGWIFSSDLPFQTYLTATLLTLPPWLFVMITMRNFGLSRIQKSPRNFAYIAYACLIGIALFTLAFYFLRQTLFSRLLLLMAGAFSSIAVYVWHIIFDRIQRMVLRAGSPTYPLLVIGTNREAERLVTKLQKNKSPFTPVAVLDGRGSSKSDLAGVPILGKLNKLEEVIEEKGITHMVQCDQLEQSINLVSLCTNKGITFFLLPSLLGVIQQKEHVEALEGTQVVVVEDKPKAAWFLR